jgi:hypothetical protein
MKVPIAGEKNGTIYLDAKVPDKHFQACYYTCQGF